MELTVQQSCPSCGAAIVLHEDDNIIKCGFCDIDNYKVSRRVDRYFLPARISLEVENDNIIYVPYLRFKGAVYFIQGKEVRYKLVDTTRIGCHNSRLPVSLGLRPQAMTLQPVISGIAGKFLRQSLPTKAIFKDATKNLDLYQKKNQCKKQAVFHRAFIGEKISRIYQPLYIKNDEVLDGITNRPLGPGSIFRKNLVSAEKSQQAWEPHFISTLCPECEGRLVGESDSCVLQCRNCLLPWKEEDQVFTQVEGQIILPESTGKRYLPFWCVEYHLTGAQNLKSFADYLRFTNQPAIINPSHERQALKFFVPAFKLRPQAFLQLSARLTLKQSTLPPGKTAKISDGYPVNLDDKEAAQAIKSILASTTLAREKRFPLLKESNVKKTRCILTYLPFLQSAHDYVQEHTGASVQTAALKYGRAL